MNAPRKAPPRETEPDVLREDTSCGRDDQHCFKVGRDVVYANALSEVIDVIARTMDAESGLSNIYSVALRGLQSALGIERASILLFDPDGVMRFKAWMGISDGYRDALEGHTPWTPATLEPEPIVVTDVLQDPTLTSFLPILAREDIRALAFIPLLYRGRVLGKFMLYSREPYAFTHEMEFARALGKLVAFGIFRRKAEEELRSKAFLSSLIENIPNMIFVKDAKELRFVRFNKAGEDLVGYPRETLIGKNDYDIFPESEAHFFTAMDRNVLASGTVLDIPEEPIHTRSQGTRILHTKKIPLYDAYGNAEYLVGISEDITEKRQAEGDRLKLIQEREARMEAEKALQLRDDFLSIAAHELRTPLTPIRMYLQLVKRHLDTVASDLPQVELLRKAIRSTDQEFERFLRLVENLLDVSRMSAGRLTLDRREFDLAELVRTVVDRFRVELQKADCVVTLDISNPVVGRWDQTRLEQVIINLLTNAMKYGSRKPIEIAVAQKDERAFLEVKDQGIGITKDDQEKIFHRFERVAPIKHFGGFGLGLFISREIVNAHGGTIHLTSEPGVGSTFTVELPLS